MCFWTQLESWTNCARTGFDYTIYFDTGILLKLYSAEADSAKAIALVQRFGSPICFTDLQDAELRNALYRKNARHEIARPELRKALRDLQSDIDQAILQPSVDRVDRSFCRSEALNLQVCFFYSMPDSGYSACRYRVKPRSCLARLDRRASASFGRQGRSESCQLLRARAVVVLADRCCASRSAKRTSVNSNSNRDPSTGFPANFLF